MQTDTNGKIKKILTVRRSAVALSNEVRLTLFAGAVLKPRSSLNEKRSTFSITITLILDVMLQSPHVNSMYIYLYDCIKHSVNKNS